MFQTTNQYGSRGPSPTFCCQSGDPSERHLDQSRAPHAQPDPSAAGTEPIGWPCSTLGWWTRRRRSDLLGRAGLDPNCLVATPRTCQLEINMAGGIGKIKSLSEFTDDYIIYMCVCACIFKMHFLGWLHLCSVPGKRMKKACLQLFGPSFTIFGPKQDVDPSMWVSKLCIQIIRWLLDG